jgi:hypothetical protein
MQTAKMPYKQWVFGVTFGANEKLGELATQYVQEWGKFYDKKDFLPETLKQADVAYRAIRDREHGETLWNIIKTSAETYSVSGSVKPVWQSILASASPRSPEGVNW